MKQGLTTLCVTALVFSLNAMAENQFLEIGAGYRRTDTNQVQGASTLTFLQANYGVIGVAHDFSMSFQYQGVDDGNASETGVGDIYASIGYRQLLDSSVTNYLRTSFAIKLPTADETRGLGTGETDYGLFVNYRRQISVLAWTYSAGYVVTGDPPGTDISDSFIYGIMGSRRFSRSYLSLGLEGGLQTSNQVDDPLAMVGHMFFQVYPARFIHFSYMAGISDASPDYGFAIGVVSWF